MFKPFARIRTKCLCSSSKTMADAAPQPKCSEFEPPAACVSRIIKQSLPENIQITKDARAAFARAAGIFIFYLTHCANDFCHDHKRQTIYTADVINALRELDFEEFIGPLEEFLEAYKKEEGSKKISKERKGTEIDPDQVTEKEAADVEEEEMGAGDDDGDVGFDDDE